MIFKYLGSDHPPAQFKSIHSLRIAHYCAAEIELPSQASVQQLLMRLRVERPDSNWALRPFDFAPSALFFDMDATVIGQESLVEMAQLIGVGDKVAEITERAMRGELDFGAALAERVLLLQGQSNEIYERIWPRISINPGLENLVRRMRSRGAPCFLVSGGFVPLAAKIAENCGFADYRANVLAESEGRLTGTVEGDIVDAEEKRRWMLATVKKLGISDQGVIAVGDGANDRLMLEASRLAVGYQPKAVIRNSLQVQIADGDYRFLEELLTW